MTERINGIANQFASATMFEDVDIGSGDHACAINGGVAYAVFCTVDGEVLVFNSTQQDDITMTLVKGYNPIVVTLVQDTSTIAGTVTLLAW